jgi:hypothetical protein
MDQEFLVRRVDGEWLVEGSCIDKEITCDMQRVKELLDISAEQMIYDEEHKEK